MDYGEPHELVGKADFVMVNPPFNVDDIDAGKVKTVLLSRKFNTLFALCHKRPFASLAENSLRSGIHTDKFSSSTCLPKVSVLVVAHECDKVLI